METIIKFIIVFVFCVQISTSKAKTIDGHSVDLQVLDKVTSRIDNIKIQVGKNYRFGSLKIEIYMCKKNPPEEIPEDFVLMQIYDEINLENIELVFQGWMISSEPSLAPFEHPNYDVWVKNCIIDEKNSNS
tara:strand:+ start:475 stop:867 length:393 start_codon:yes stop_codon:yes gene_type:complete